MHACKKTATIICKNIIDNLVQIYSSDRTLYTYIGDLRHGMHIKLQIYNIYNTSASVVEWLGRRTCDQEVAGSNPGRRAVECNLGRLFTYTCASVIKQYNLVPANER